MSLLLLFAGDGSTPATPAANVTLTFTATAAGVAVGTRGFAGVTLEFSATATAQAAIAAASWTIDDSQKASLTFTATAAGSTNTPVTPPPAAVTSAIAPIKRVSITMPPPTLDAQGRPT